MAKRIKKHDQFAIEINNFVKKFDKKDIIGPLSTQIKKGSTTLLVGRSGTGKSVLLNSLMGSYTRYKGQIYINGYRRKSLFGYKSNSEIGFYTQMDFLLYDITLKNYMNQITHLFGIPKIYRKQRITELLKYFELYEHLDKKIKDFSWGMKNRLNLVLAFIKYPKILILDEPGANLDSVWRKKVIDKIKEFQAKGTTILIVVHNIDEMIDLADEFFVLDNGQIIFQSEFKIINLYFKIQLQFTSTLVNNDDYTKFKNDLQNYQFKIFEENIQHKTLEIGLLKSQLHNINSLVGLLVLHQLYLKQMRNIPMNYESIHNSIEHSNQVKEFNFYFQNLSHQGFKKMVRALQIKYKKLKKKDKSSSELFELKSIIDTYKAPKIEYKTFFELFGSVSNYFKYKSLSSIQKTQMLNAIMHATKLKKLSVIEEDLLRLAIPLYLRKEYVIHNKAYLRDFKKLNNLVNKYPKFNFPKRYLKLSKINQNEIKERKFIAAFRNILFW